MGKKDNAHIFAASFTATLIILRLFLFVYPSANFNIGQYNVHHLFTGAAILIISTMLLVNHFSNRFVIMAAGLGSALVVDQIFYIIATDGSDSAYFSKASLHGAITLGIATIVLLYIFSIGKKLKS